MRRASAFAFVSLSALALASCGSANKAADRDRADPITTPAESSAASSAASDSGASGRAAGAPPSIGVTAAPGVAFNYHHSFALEPDRIAAVQEQHAAACEALGAAHCRITGMSYRRRTDHDIEGRLEFKLDPNLARHFGQSALGNVQEAGGMLVESRISGTDLNPAIRQTGKSIDQLNDDLARIQRQIADSSVPAGQKESLRYEANSIRQQIRALHDNQEAQQESLATTPVVFDYGTDEALASGPNFASGLRKAGEVVVWGLYGIMLAAVTVLPFVAFFLLLLLVLRPLARRLRRAEAPTIAADMPAPNGS